jgi:hypothetical protein
MHIVTLGYPEIPTEEDKGAAIHFFESLVRMIPCPICQEHYRITLEQYPVAPATGSRTELAIWAFTIHNKVNEQLNRPQFTMQQYIESLQLLSKEKQIRLPPEATPPPEKKPVAPTQSVPLFTGIGILLGAGVGATAMYYYLSKHS